MTELTEFSGRVSVTLEEINQQREKGWIDFHPEHFCHRCGGRNISWWAPAEVWLVVMEALQKWQGIICVPCFYELFHQTYPLTCFKIVPDPLTKGGIRYYRDHPVVERRS